MPLLCNELQSKRRLSGAPGNRTGEPGESGNGERGEDKDPCSHLLSLSSFKLSHVNIKLFPFSYCFPHLFLFISCFLPFFPVSFRFFLFLPVFVCSTLIFNVFFCFFRFMISRALRNFWYHNA